MKRNAFLLFVMFFLIFQKNSYAQAPDWTRVLQLSTYGLQNVNAVTADASNVYTAASISGSATFDGINYTSVGYRDMIIVKASNTGVVGWVKQLSALASGTIYANAIKVDASGNIFIAGTLSGSVTIGSNTITSSASVNAFIAKFDADGNGIWATSFIFSGTGSSKIALDATGNIYLLSYSTKLLKFDSNGVKQWEQEYVDKTLQAIAVYGSTLYIGGCLQSGTTNFGSIALTSLGSYNTGYLVKADLDGIYTESLVVGGSTAINRDGSSVSDIVCDNSGNLFITGGYVKDLILGAVTISNPSSSYYTYIAKCDNNFVFSWAKSSTSLYDYYRSIWTYRIFLDNSNNIYEFGMNSCTFSFESISVNSSNKQFLFKFDSDGNAIRSYALQNTAFNKTTVSPGGDVIVTGTYSYSGSPSYGNFFITDYDNDLTPIWEKVLSISFSGDVDVFSVKHDSDRNTYLYSGVIGYCDYFGTIVNTNSYVTIISKHDVNGNLLWMKQIGDEKPNLFGVKFTLDKNSNVLIVGTYNTSLTLGGTTLTTSNPEGEGYVAKYSTSGDLLWAKDANGVTFINVTSDISGNVIVTGVNSPDNYLIKFDELGNQLWEKSFPMESYYTSLVSTDANNNIYLTSEVHLDWSGITSIAIGSITLNQTAEDGSTVLVKFDPDGNAIWAKPYGGVSGASNADGWPCDIKTDSEGNSYIWGWCVNNSIFGTTTLINPFATTNKYSFFLAKVNTLGDVVWAKAVYETKYSFNYGDLLDLDKNGNAYIGGHFIDKISIDATEYTPEGKYDAFMVKYSTTGAFQWIKTIPSDAGAINALSIFDDNILTVGGDAGKNPTLGSFPIERKGGTSCMAATLGSLLYFSVSTSSLTIAAPEGSTNTFEITSNVSWTVESDQPWLTISSASGSGDATITLTASANPTTATRAATVTVSGSGVTAKTITVTQDGATPSLSVSSNDLTIAAPEGSTNTFEITSNVSWTVESDQPWLTISSASGSGDATITLTASANPSTTTRAATVTVSGTDVTSKTITVTQDANTTGVNDEIAGQEAVKIYPNPSNGRFNIGLSHYTNETVEVSVSNVLGNIVKEFTLKGLTEYNVQEIDLGGMAKGNYFVIIKTNKNTVVKSITITNP